MFKKVLRAILKFILSTIVYITYRVKKVGEDNIKKGEPYIICANHIGELDAVVLVLATKRKIDFIAKQELFKNMFIRFLGYAFDVIPIKRGQRDLEAMKKSIKVLKQKEILGIFPEGTRNGLAKKEKVKTGAVYLALKNNVKIIPVGIQGTFKPFTKVVLNYGKEMDFSEYSSRNPEKEVLENLTIKVMEEIIKLTNEEV